MLAICLKNGWIRYTQIDIKNRLFVLNRLEQNPLSTELKICDLSSPELALQFHNLFQRVVDSLSIPEHEVFLSLGSEWVDCFLLEIDRLFSSEESEDYLNWVFEQRQGILWKDTITFFQKIESEGSGTIQVWICLAMRYVIESIKEALRKLSIDPVWIEPNVQSIMRVVTNAVDISTLNSMVLESSGDTFRAQFQKRNRLKALANIKLRSGKLTPVFVRGDAVFVDQCISDFNRFNLSLILISIFTQSLSLSPCSIL